MSTNLRHQRLRKYCYTCGSPWLKDQVACEKCGSNDYEEGSARPVHAVEGDGIRFDGPWRMLPWPPQGVVAMFGGPGSGKSSLASMIDPKVWISKEQEPRPIGDMWRRTRPKVAMPETIMVNDADELATALSRVSRGPLVLDSATALGPRDGLRASYLVSQWAKDHGERALLIAQVNAQGDIAGYNEIPHLVDATVNIAPDPWGVRAFRIEKSRWSSLDQVYWTFNEEGGISQPDFEAAYTVEGTPGAYHLHPYPLPGAKWNGGAAALAGADRLEPGTASSAIGAKYMKSGFVEPMDSSERKRFAENNGLKWLSAKLINEILAQAKEQEE